MFCHIRLSGAVPSSSKLVMRTYCWSVLVGAISALVAQMASAETITQCTTLGGKSLRIITDSYSKIIEVQVDDQAAKLTSLYHGGRGGEGSSFEIENAKFIRHMRKWQQRDRFGMLQPLSCSVTKTDTPAEF